MLTNKQKLLLGFLIFNVTLVVVNISGEWNNLRGKLSSIPINTLTILNGMNATENLASSLRPNIQDSEPAPLEDSKYEPEPEPEVFPHEDSEPEPEAEPVCVHPLHQMAKVLEELNWDPVRVDEVVRDHFDTERSFLRYRTSRNKTIKTILTTSCLHNAAWIAPALLATQPRDNVYYGLYKKPTDKSLIVYDNTREPVSTEAAPCINALRSFIDARPKNESILLQFDMNEKLNYTGPYIDHHFALQIYNDSVNVYQGWQHQFSILDWMSQPYGYKLRYPMALDTWLYHFEKLLTYTTDEKGKAERLDSIWEILGVSAANTYSEKGIDDPDDIVVWPLKFRWEVPLITHWPNMAPPSETVAE